MITYKNIKFNEKVSKKRETLFKIGMSVIECKRVMEEKETNFILDISDTIDSVNNTHIMSKAIKTSMMIIEELGLYRYSNKMLQSVNEFLSNKTIKEVFTVVLQAYEFFAIQNDTAKEKILRFESFEKFIDSIFKFSVYELRTIVTLEEIISSVSYVCERVYTQVQTVVNLTPHDIVILNEDGTEKIVYKSEGIARVSATQTLSYQFTDQNCLQHDVYKPSYGEVSGLPAQQDGFMYIVSGMVKSALPDRNDCICPNALLMVRENGVPKGTQAFQE